MKKIRLTMDIAIHEDAGLSIEEIMEGITVLEDDVSDGFIVTTNIEGYEPVHDYFLDYVTGIKLEIVEESKNK